MNVLVTGAAAGLAQGIALALARAGNDVAITYRPGGTPPNATLDAIAEAGFRARAYPVEFLGDPSGVESALAAASQNAPQALVHAVGPMIVRRFEHSTMAAYTDMIDGNLRSAVLSARAVLPAMRAAGFGRLIFFGINGSHATLPARGLALHGAAKAGLVAFARALALEEARHGITVNVIEPGDIADKTLARIPARTKTASNPRGRPGSWEDIADAVLFLLREESDFINGIVLPVTGGSIEAHERNAPTQ
jgi:3-oxoacyl-[acyl-carrier protein] reductase